MARFEKERPSKAVLINLSFNQRSDGLRACYGAERTEMRNKQKERWRVNIRSVAHRVLISRILHALTPRYCYFTVLIPY